MNKNRLLALSIASSIALLTITFYVGYVVGEHHSQSTIESATTLTPNDMDRAFGSVKVPTQPHDNSGKEPMAMSLSGLVAGLEKKVAEHPENIDQQLLLAQTYNELDEKAKGLKLLNTLNKQAPKNAQVKVTLATALMAGTDIESLKTAMKLFDEAIKLKPELSGMARDHQEQINLKLSSLNLK
jgi:cytochrome c-type biogenesis protein CcmH/NrfG